MFLMEDQLKIRYALRRRVLVNEIGAMEGSTFSSNVLHYNVACLICDGCRKLSANEDKGFFIDQIILLVNE